MSFPNDSSVTALQKTHCIKQDKLILWVILASTTLTITSFISTTTTSQEAWHKLNTMYASKFRSSAMQLKEKLTLLKKRKQIDQRIYTHSQGTHRWDCTYWSSYIWRWPHPLYSERSRTRYLRESRTHPTERKTTILRGVSWPPCEPWKLATPSWNHTAAATANRHD